MIEAALLCVAAAYVFIGYRFVATLNMDDPEIKKAMSSLPRMQQLCMMFMWPCMLLLGLIAKRKKERNKQ